MSAVLPIASISPASTIDFASASATPSQQSVFNGLVTQLEQSISSGDLTTSQTLLNALTALSPSSESSSSPIGAFLTGVGSALSAGSATEAQSALSTYLSATPAPAAATTSAASTSATAASIASSLVLSQIQLSLVSSLLAPASVDGSGQSANTTAQNPTDSLIALLNAAYPSSHASASTAASTSSTAATSTASPYDTLVSAIQSNLAAGTDPSAAALAYLSSSGNFVNANA